MYAAAGSTDDSRLMTGWRISSAAPSPTGEVAALEREIRQATGGVGQGRLWEGGRCRCSQFECLPHPPLGQGRSRCPMVGSPVAAQISHAGARPRRAHRWLDLARRRWLASSALPTHRPPRPCPHRTQATTTSPYPWRDLASSGPPTRLPGARLPRSAAVSRRFLPYDIGSAPPASAPTPGGRARRWGARNWRAWWWGHGPPRNVRSFSSSLLDDSIEIQRLVENRRHDPMRCLLLVWISFCRDSGELGRPAPRSIFLQPVRGEPNSIPDHSPTHLDLILATVPLARPAGWTVHSIVIRDAAAIREFIFYSFYKNIRLFQNLAKIIYHLRGPWRLGSVSLRKESVSPSVD
jgi:hypothetical protein